MSKVDANGYRKNVLQPWSADQDLREHLKDAVAALRLDHSSTAYLNLDLHELLQVTESASVESLQGHVQQLRLALNKANRLPLARQVQELLDLLGARRDVDLEDPEFWSSFHGQRQKHVLARLGSEAAAFAADYPLGIITRSAAHSHRVSGRDVTEPTWERALNEAGLKVVDDLVEPTGEIPMTVRKTWQAVRTHAQFRSPFDLVLLHQDQPVKGARFINTLHVSGAAVTLEDVRTSRTRTAQGRDSDALQDAGKCLGAILSSCSTTEELQTIVFRMVLDLAASSTDGRAARSVRDALVDKGLDSEEVARVVDHLGSATRRRPGADLDMVRSALADRQLAEARRTWELINPGADEEAEHANYGARLVELESQRDASVAAYEKALAARDYVAAARAAREAQSADHGAVALQDLLDSIPPPAPERLAASTTDRVVTLTWSGPDDEMTVVVLRNELRPPANPKDGTVLDTGESGASMRDTGAPVARRCWYAAFTSRDGTTFSEPATVEHVFLPSPSNVSVEPGADYLDLSWTPRADSLGIEVRSVQAGRAPTAPKMVTGSGTQVGGLLTGLACTSTLTALYSVDGQLERSAPVTVSATPRPEARPVMDLRIEDAGARLGHRLISWSGQEGYDVEIWSAPGQVPVGRYVDHVALPTREFRRLAVGGRAVGQRHQVEIQAPAGISCLIPMLVTGRGLLPGQALVVGSVEPPAATTAERFADAVRVSWEWPPDVQIVEVRWHDGAQERVRRVSRARYQADGGVRLSHGAHVERVRVASVMRLDDEDWVSAPALVSLPSKHKTRMTYTLTQRRSLLGRRSCLVTAQSPTALVAEVKLVLHRGSYMPGPHDGQEIDRFVLDLAPDQPGEHVVDVPKTSSPYWLRLFLTDTDAAIELVDPLNTSQLKG